MAVRALKIKPGLDLEQEHEGPVCGIDEAGRGPLAGPVVAACIYLPPDLATLPAFAMIDDSKKMTAKRRDIAFAALRDMCPHGIGMAGPEEIDTLNIHHATLLAMRRAFGAMTASYAVRPLLALVDGKFTPDLPCAGRAVIGGDSRSLSIAAASVLAKVTRDRIMSGLHDEFPAYGWRNNAGYGTAEHLAALREFGVTPHHRHSYAPVKEAL